MKCSPGDDECSVRDNGLGEVERTLIIRGTGLTLSQTVLYSFGVV